MSGAKTLRDFLPGMVVACGAILALVIIASNSDVHEPSLWKMASKILWTNASTRPPLLLVLAVAGWAWVVQVCHSCGMKIELVLGGPTQPISATYHAALTLLCVVLCARLAYFVASEHEGLHWRPWLTCNLGLLTLVLALGAMPCRTFHATSRFSLLRALFDSVVAPCAPVTFWHVIVADYLTSLAKTFSDLQLTACISYAIVQRDQSGAAYETTTNLWNEHHAHCSVGYGNALMLALPFWLRLMQCFKVFSQTGEQKNLWNALKYSTAFPLVYAGYLRKTDPSAMHDQLFVLAAITQSTYCFVWDVLMDWGLPYRARRDDEGLCGLRMRTPLVVSRSKALYLSLCAFNFGLRFIWALSIFGSVPGRSWGMFFLEVVEMARRTVWAVFRVEWEMVHKIYEKDPSSMPLSAAENDEEGEEMGLLQAES